MRETSGQRDRKAYLRAELLRLRRELTASYEAAIVGRSNPLPALAMQYRDFAAEQNRRLNGPEGERMAAQWRQRLGGERSTLALPT